MNDVLVSDLDGTVVFRDGVRHADRAALQRWHDAGNTLVLDTGKSIDAVRRVWHDEGLLLPDYVIAFTGGVITDAALRPLVEHSHDPGTLAQVADVLDDEQVALYASDIERDYEVFNHVGRTSTILPTFKPASLQWLSTRRLFGIPVFVPQQPDQVRIAAELGRVLASCAAVHRNQDFIDIVPAGATKGSALRELVDHVLPAHGRVITLGDSWNDLSMHEQADLSVTLRSAPREVIDQCDMAVDSAAELIERLLGGSAEPNQAETIPR
ncbi:hypothetical protein SAMN05443377_12918 [Propionibacterium cyclohexanicum]|uniref:Hydroxymethylpyrimidine pyrophosphatase n=1 Tax=Propionibacterium cyclohexanicum TaxID=64702 RepID=A0A1H9TV63_9ACTN|nr:HAD hydrolase family protein [Propionibacterium cyclohexanicum]SES01066.1 hypothetical protein SAMN05443377_12918 [Propionibacterium cyclohexanicum]